MSEHELSRSRIIFLRLAVNGTAVAGAFALTIAAWRLIHPQPDEAVYTQPNSSPGENFTRINAVPQIPPGVDLGRNRISPPSPTPDIELVLDQFKKDFNSIPIPQNLGHTSSK